MQVFLKKIGIITLVCVFVVMAVACGLTSSTGSEKKEITLSKGEEKSTDNNESKEISSKKSEDVKVETTIDELVIVDRDGIKITAKEFVTDSIWGDGIKLLIENTSEKNVSVGCDALIVNDYMIYDLFYSDIAAGKKSNETLYLSSGELKNAGIDNIGKIEIDFYASDADSYSRIFENEFVTLNTSLLESMDTSTDTDGVELYNANDVKIIGKIVNEHDIWGTAVVLYIENNRQENVGISCDDMSINGFMVSPYFYSEVYAGKKAVDEITILESDLEENGIESVEDIELTFRIYNPDTYDTIDETDSIAFSTK